MVRVVLLASVRARHIPANVLVAREDGGHGQGRGEGGRELDDVAFRGGLFVADD